MVRRAGKRSNRDEEIGEEKQRKSGKEERWRAGIGGIEIKTK